MNHVAHDDPDGGADEDIEPATSAANRRGRR
jgi:hypothetical protein